MTDITTKTPTDILAERLAELSASIPAKIGKAPRERAEQIAESYVRQEKQRLTAEFHAWVLEGVLLDLPKAHQELWRQYNDRAGRMIAHLKRIGTSSQYDNASRNITEYPLTLPEFVTGKRFSNVDSIMPLCRKVPGYDERKAALDARHAELDAIREASKASIWRTYRNRNAVTQDGIDIGEAIADIVKGAIGNPLLGAPVEPEIVT